MKLKLVRAGVLLLFVALFTLGLFPTITYAQPAPDSTPTVETVKAYRNVLETGDFFVMLMQNTPYASTPTIPYSQAFIWQFMSVDGTNVLGEALGYDFNANGYGYNVISFYWSAAQAPAWGLAYKLKLVGTPIAFSSPVSYSVYTMGIGNYSSLTNTIEVKRGIASWVITWVRYLDQKWGLTSSYYLEVQTDTGTYLSSAGESYFRGAIYGCQAVAPAAFQLTISQINTQDRSWGTQYIDALKTMYAGTYLQAAFLAGQSYWQVDYNLMGLLLVIGMCLTIIFEHWIISGGNIWRGMIECAGPLVVAGRLNLIGLGELGLVTAMCWIYVSAKTWRML